MKSEYLSTEIPLLKEIKVPRPSEKSELLNSKNRGQLVVNTIEIYLRKGDETGEHQTFQYECFTTETTITDHKEFDMEFSSVQLPSLNEENMREDSYYGYLRPQRGTKQSKEPVDTVSSKEKPRYVLSYTFISKDYVTPESNIHIHDK